jgi:hypothetical protein
MLHDKEDLLFNDMCTREQRLQKGFKNWLKKWKIKNAIDDELVFECVASYIRN